MAFLNVGHACSNIIYCNKKNNGETFDVIKINVKEIFLVECEINVKIEGRSLHSGYKCMFDMEVKDNYDSPYLGVKNLSFEITDKQLGDFLEKVMEVYKNSRFDFKWKRLKEMTHIEESVMYVVERYENLIIKSKGRTS